MSPAHERRETTSIAPLLGQLAYSPTDVTADFIASKFALIFEHKISDVQSAAFLALLHCTKKDREPDVIARCSKSMREAASPIDETSLQEAVKASGRPEGNYQGGLCDIVGTGGDSHSTFNISTTASIVASPILMTAKHGNRASSSLSGSADVLKAIRPIPPNIDAVNGSNIAQIYKETNYAFLFAPHFHPGMAYANFVRKELGIRTIFNLVGPLVNPVESAIEARVVGVAYQSLGPIFAEAFRQSGAKKALVVCGEEDLDEISCAGLTNCWRISERKEVSSDTHGPSNGEEGGPHASVHIDAFQLHPSDFGLSTHPLADVFGRKMPEDNAAKLMSILRNELPRDDPILEFVLINTAALLVTSGVCEAESSDLVPGETITERGPGGGRWKEGVRRARWAIESGQALKSLEGFIEVTNQLG